MGPTHHHQYRIRIGVDVVIALLCRTMLFANGIPIHLNLCWWHMFYARPLSARCSEWSKLELVLPMNVFLFRCAFPSGWMSSTTCRTHLFSRLPAFRFPAVSDSCRFRNRTWSCRSNVLLQISCWALLASRPCPSPPKRSVWWHLEIIAIADTANMTGYVSMIFHHWPFIIKWDNGLFLWIRCFILILFVVAYLHNLGDWLHVHVMCGDILILYWICWKGKHDKTRIDDLPSLTFLKKWDNGLFLWIRWYILIFCVLSP